MDLFHKSVQWKFYIQSGEELQGVIQMWRDRQVEKGGEKKTAME